MTEFIGARHLNKIINFLELAGKDIEGEGAVLRCMAPGVPDITTGDIKEAKQELYHMVALADKPENLAPIELVVPSIGVDAEGQPSCIFYHNKYEQPEILVREVLGVQRIEAKEVKLLPMSTTC